MKVPKSKYNRQCLNLKLIAEGILRYFSNKSAFDDKLKVSCPAGVDNYQICMHCFETKTCAFWTRCRISLMCGVTRFIGNIFHNNVMNSFRFLFVLHVVF